jgi:hypothetical protein
MPFVHPSSGSSDSISMSNPSPATRTTPPAVEYVAVGPDGAWVVTVVVTGGGAATVVAGAGRVVGGEVAVVGDLRVTVVRTTRVVVVGAGRVVVVVVGGTVASWLTTSRRGTTGAGRSVTSAATVEVAVHTMAVEIRVATSQRPTANNRGIVTAQACPRRRADGLSGA